MKPASQAREFREFVSNTGIAGLGIVRRYVEELQGPAAATQAALLTMAETSRKLGAAHRAFVLMDSGWIKAAWLRFWWRLRRKPVAS